MMMFREIVMNALPTSYGLFSQSTYKEWIA